MLTLPPFQLHQPDRVAEAVQLRHEAVGAMYLAGGTDLMPNLKHRLYPVEHLISLAKVSWSGLRWSADGGVEIGAASTMQLLSTDARLRQSFPGLAAAAGLVAGPIHRRQATLGGNVMLDTRCLFYNQSKPWREALGGCLKCEGDHCHVLNSPRSCVAAQSADTVPMLIALGAKARFEAVNGPVELGLAEMFTKDGRLGRRLAVGEGDLLTSVVVPAPRGPSVFRKVRRRASIDFPQLNVGLSLAIEDGRVADLRVVVGAVMPAPKPVRGVEEAVGGRLEDAVIEALAASAQKSIRPQRTVQGDVGWRRQMVGVEVRRGLVALRRAAEFGGV